MKANRALRLILVPLTTACLIAAGTSVANASSADQASAETVVVGSVSYRLDVATDDQSYDQMLAALQGVPADLQNVDPTVGNNGEKIEAALSRASANASVLTAAENGSRRMPPPMANPLWCAISLVQAVLELGLPIAALVTVLVAARAKFGSVAEMWRAIRCGYAAEIIGPEGAKVVEKLREMRSILRACAPRQG